MNMNRKPSRVLAAVACACLAWSAAPALADHRVTVETARPAVHTTEPGRGTQARLTQFVSPIVGGYAYAPTSYYVAPTTTWTTSFYTPGGLAYTAYQPYVAHWPVGYSYSYGWLPYAYHYRPYGSFYRYYGPVYGSGFHMWFGY